MSWEWSRVRVWPEDVPLLYDALRRRRVELLAEKARLRLLGLSGDDFAEIKAQLKAFTRLMEETQRCAQDLEVDYLELVESAR